MADTKVTSIRTDEETAARFKEVAEQFPNGAECLKALINAHEMAQAKGVLTGQETSIADFQAHADSLVKSYIAVLELTANAENRIRQEFQQQLESKDSTIISLQKSLKGAESDVQVADERATAAKTALQDLQTQLESAYQRISEQADTIRADKSTISDKEKIISGLQAELDTAKKAADSVPELTVRATKAESETESLTRQLETERQTAISAAKIAEAEKKEAIAEIKAANADKMESLYAEISRLKDEIRELNKSKSASDTAKDDDTQ